MRKKSIKNYYKIFSFIFIWTFFSYGLVGQGT